MSTIVAAVKNGVACIAADSLTSFGDTKQSAEFVVDSDKILLLANSSSNANSKNLAYMGIVGSAAHQLVMQSLVIDHADKIDLSDRMSIFNTLKTIHPILKEEYFLNSKEEDDDSYESSRVDALIMNENGIFGLYSLREVEQYSRFWAVGSGSEFALGAMQTAYEIYDTAEQIAQAGVVAGATFDNASSLPMTSYTLKLK
ncbi:MAG: ATP-dependent HslUV protease subunit HslV [Candidatus Azotimanducaceae bacterium]|jgi:ATP-dependent HslUV protease subunit HslV